MFDGGTAATTLDDAGDYECQLSSTPLRTHVVRLRIIGEFEFHAFAFHAGRTAPPTAPLLIETWSPATLRIDEHTASRPPSFLRVSPPTSRPAEPRLRSSSPVAPKLSKQKRLDV